MRSFADILTTVAAEADATKRVLTTRDKVKTALKLGATDDDTLIDQLIARVTGLIEGGSGCRLARDVAGAVPTFASETLRATWLAECDRRPATLYLPWRVPVSSIDLVVEDGVELAVNADYRLAAVKPGRLLRLSSGRPTCWSSAEIVVAFKAGFSLPGGVDGSLEAACIDQVKAMLKGAERDPALRQQSTNEVGFEAYALPGGDTVRGVLLPQVLDAIAPFINPLP